MKRYKRDEEKRRYGEERGGRREMRRKLKEKHEDVTREGTEKIEKEIM